MQPSNLRNNAIKGAYVATDEEDCIDFLQWESFSPITFIECEMIHTIDVLFLEGIWLCLCCPIKNGKLP